MNYVPERKIIGTCRFEAEYLAVVLECYRRARAARLGGSIQQALNLESYIEKVRVQKVSDDFREAVLSDLDGTLSRLELQVRMMTPKHLAYALTYRHMPLDLAERLVYWWDSSDRTGTFWDLLAYQQARIIEAFDTFDIVDDEY